MAFDEGLVEWVREALEPMGLVTMRRMMGVATLYCDGIVFAVVDDSEVWFKGDAESAATWDEAGCERFTFTEKDGTLYATVIGRPTGTKLVIKDLRLQGTATVLADGSPALIRPEGADTAVVLAKPLDGQSSPVIRVAGP